MPSLLTVFFVMIFGVYGLVKTGMIEMAQPPYSTVQSVSLSFTERVTGQRAPATARTAGYQLQKARM